MPLKTQRKPLTSNVYTYDECGMDFISCQKGHTLRPLTTVTKARHKRECPPSDSVPFTTKHRTNIPLSPRTNCSTPWERNPKVILVYLLLSLRSIIRQLTLLHTLSTNDIVCGPPPPLRGPGLQLHYCPPTQRQFGDIFKLSTVLFFIVSYN